MTAYDQRCLFDGMWHLRLCGKFTDLIIVLRDQSGRSDTMQVHRVVLAKNSSKLAALVDDAASANETYQMPHVFIDDLVETKDFDTFAALLYGLSPQAMLECDTNASDTRQIEQVSRAAALAYGFGCFKHFEACCEAVLKVHAAERPVDTSALRPLLDAIEEANQGWTDLTGLLYKAYDESLAHRRRRLVSETANWTAHWALHLIKSIESPPEKTENEQNL